MLRRRQRARRRDRSYWRWRRNPPTSRHLIKAIENLKLDFADIEGFGVPVDISDLLESMNANEALKR